MLINPAAEKQAVNRSKHFTNTAAIVFHWFYAGCSRLPSLVMPPKKMTRL
jgi:hypothetical protein